MDSSLTASITRMALDNNNAEQSRAGKPAEQDDVGDAFARSPSDVTHADSDHSHGLRSRELGSMRSSSRFAGSSSGVFFLRTVCDAIAKASTSENLSLAPSVNLRFIPGEDERAGDSNGCLWHAAEVANTFDTPWPSFDDLVALISETYIRGWHCLIPFLQAETTLQALEAICLEGSTDNWTPEAVSIRSIISISLLDRRQMPISKNMTPLPACLVFWSLEDCNKGIHALLGNNSLASIQGMLSAQIFMISIMELRSASRLGGWIIRLAFDLGLHRCPYRYRLSFGEGEIAIRQRIFWVIYSLDRYLCQALGLPLGIRDEDVDVCLPNDEIHRPPEGKSWHDINGCVIAQDNRLIPLVLLSQYSTIKGRLMEISNKCMLHRTSDAEYALRNVHVDILKWRNQVEDFIHTIFGDENDEAIIASSSSSSSARVDATPKAITPSHQLLFQIQYHELLLLMHRPALSTKPTSEAHPVAMLTCLSSARSIISMTRGYLLRHQVSDGRVKHPLLWHVMLSTIWMSGLVIIFAAFERSISFDTANRDIQKVWSILEHLSLRLPGKPKACEVALRALFQLMCRKRGFPRETISMTGRTPKRHKRYDPENVQSEESALECLPRPDTITPSEIHSSTQDIVVVNEPVSIEGSDTHTIELPSNISQGAVPSPSQASLDENQVLWLLDVPNLLDDQSLNMFSGQDPSVDIQNTDDFNADALFHALRMNMGSEDASTFLDDTQLTFM